MTKVRIGMVFSILFVCSCLPAAALEWEPPVFTLKYELAHGIREDLDEEMLLPSSLRNTVSLRIKETADPAVFDFMLRYSQKDYFMAAGDYGYLEMEHEQTWRVSDPLRLGFLLGTKRVDFPELDESGWAKDYFSLRFGPTVALALAEGAKLDGSIGLRYDFADNPSRSFQSYVISTGISSRLDGWQIAARYRGEFRLPFDDASAVAQLAYNTCSVTLQWDPSK